MPNTKSAAKRLRQSNERRARNRAVRSAVKTQIKKVREAADAGNVDAAKTELNLAYKRLDQAAAKGVIHKNTASRVKSRLSSHVKAKSQTAA